MLICLLVEPAWFCIQEVFLPSCFQNTSALLTYRCRIDWPIHSEYLGGSLTCSAKLFNFYCFTWGGEPFPFKSSKEKAKLHVSVRMGNAYPSVNRRELLRNSVGSKAAELYVTDFLLLWHMHLLWGEKKSQKCETKWFLLVEVSLKIPCLLRWGKEFLFLSKLELSYRLPEV